MNGLKDEIVGVYDQTDASVEKLVEDLEASAVSEDADVRQSVDRILGNMNEKKLEFKKRIAELEADSEFEKFTIAFFGQTNAGKSTIIEALRILFDEEGRRAKIKENLGVQERLRTDAISRSEDVIRRLEELKKGYRRTPFLRRFAARVLWFLVGLSLGIVLAWRFL